MANDKTIANRVCGELKKNAEPRKNPDFREYPENFSVSEGTNYASWKVAKNIKGIAAMKNKKYRNMLRIAS